MPYREAVDAGCFSRHLSGLRGRGICGVGVGVGVGTRRIIGFRGGYRILGISEGMGCLVGRAGINVGRGKVMGRRLSVDSEHHSELWRGEGEEEEGAGGEEGGQVGDEEPTDG